MTDISDATDLIETAREALLRELIPALSGERRYLALMIANAMAIAAREHRLRAAAMRSEAVRLGKLLAEIGRVPRRPQSAGDTGELPALRREVSVAIRAGDFDRPEHADALAATLDRTTRDWLAISNPKALRSDSATPPSADSEPIA